MPGDKLYGDGLYGGDFDGTQQAPTSGHIIGRSKNAAIISEKSKKAVTFFWLIKIGDHCFCNSSVALSLNNEVYSPTEMQLPGFSSVDGGPLDSGMIKIGNLPTPPDTVSLISSLVVSGSLVRQPVSVYKTWFDASMTLIDYEEIFIGKVNGYPGLDDTHANIAIEGYLNSQTRQWGRRIMRSNFPEMPARGTRFTIFGNIVEVV